MNDNRPEILLTATKFLDATTTNWADLHHFICSQYKGLIAVAYPDIEERKEFYSTEEYKLIRVFLEESIKKHGVIQGGNPQFHY